MTDLKNKLDALSEAATQGEISVHTLVDGSLYAGIEKPNRASLEAVIFGIEADPEYTVDYNKRTKANVELFATLVNAYRTGDLIVKGEDTFTQAQLDQAVREAQAEAYKNAAKECWKQKAYRDEQCNSDVSDIQRARWIAGSKQAEMLAQAIESMSLERITPSIRALSAKEGE
jgi:hypothetical protein